jgi:hypothetical protein
MVENYVCLEGIAHDGTREIALEDWRRALELARWHGWQLPDERLWAHFHSPSREPEPLPGKEARHLADALEGALVSQCTHNQCCRDPRTPAVLLTWCSTRTGKQVLKDVVALLRGGGLYVFAGTVT